MKYSEIVRKEQKLGGTGNEESGGWMLDPIVCLKKSEVRHKCRGSLCGVHKNKKT